VANDVFSMLEQDHRQVERMLGELAESEEGPERAATLNQLTTALSLHMRFEEAEIYPLVAKELDRESAEEAEIEHGLARDGLAKLNELVSAPGFGAAVEMLKGGIGHHVEEEEGEMFPSLRKKLDDASGERLAVDLKKARDTAGVPDPRWEQASKDELLDAARQAGIEGRSSMTKDELRDALRSSADA
jgi:hemerythrin-like domain-containing protein